MSPSPFAPATILILEDMPELLLMEEYVLRGLWPQANFVACLQLEKALEYLRSSPVDLALVDLRLPDSRDPTQTLRKLAEGGLPPDCPIVVFSGYVSELDVLEMLQQGVDAAVPKSADKPAERLTKALAYAWARRNGRQVRGLLTA